MDKGKLMALQHKIRSHYRMERTPTEEEVRAEIENLRRKKGNYHDGAGMLAARLETGAYPIDIEKEID